MVFNPKYLCDEEITKILTQLTDKEFEDARSRSLTPLKSTVLFKGEGSYVVDIKGKKYLDMTAQAWTLNHGYINQDIMYMVYKQMHYLSHVRYGFPTIPRIKLINTLAELFQFEKVSLNNEGGGLAIEAAIKLSMVNRPGKSTFIVTHRGYHGSTLATIAASNPLPSVIRFDGFGKEHFKRIPYPYCYRCPFNKKYGECNFECLHPLENLIKYDNNNDIAAMIIEPMQGPGGQIPSPPGYLENLKSILHENDILLIFDEAQTAFGRIGKWSASEYYGIKPDMMTLTKALGGGFPIGALLATAEMSGFTEGEEHTTFGSDPILFAAALASIEITKRMKLLENAERMGKYFIKRLEEIKERHSIIGDIRGVGLFIGIELIKDEKKKPATEETEYIIQRAFEKGVIFDVSMPQILKDEFTFRNVLKIKPPLIINEEEADIALSVLEDCLKEVESGI
ncbi:MAG: aspartate aminotransferase family protein [Thermoplasmata archaeon]